MHLLFISSMLPTDEPRSGFEIANRAIADEYRRQGVRLSFAGFRRPGSPVPKPGEISLGELVPENAGASRRQKAAWLARSFALGLPVSAAKLATMDAETLWSRLAEAGPVDGFILNSVQMPAAYPFLAGAKPSIFVAHNVEHRSAGENAATSRSAFRRFLYRREAALLRKVEERVCREARIVHALSADDLAGLGVDRNPAAFVLPLSVGRPSIGDDGLRRHDIGLIGTWSWAPNRLGLDWFLREVVPWLPQEITVAVAGSFDGRPPRVPANVSVLGRVPDAQAFVRASRVIALASKGGTGVQLKTIEAFEEGIPAVATPSALRGVATMPGNVAVADDAREFAAALIDAVAGERDGRVRRGGGPAFALAQRRSLAAAVKEAVTRLATMAEFERPRGRERLPQVSVFPALPEPVVVGS
ncbi:glycosyltransferase [Aureimonas leprariae]|uniref:Glycosyltransferase family 4 protein n=1 Tax=Plantimonas leprariae TaxID=2615207 RepID=A0A7V7TX07_9HYPH|nr:glycosyltransferase family 4 protein [Aureimonas leprariae]KAB0680385.1 glycosyltransferase family 4 protein [Aureimonas leprariae]